MLGLDEERSRARFDSYFVAYSSRSATVPFRSHNLESFGTKVASA